MPNLDTECYDPPCLQSLWYRILEDEEGMQLEFHTPQDTTVGIDLTFQYNSYLLKQNFPNPFHHSTTIEYNLPSRSHARLIVYDLTGKEVIVLVDNVLPAGLYQVTWNGNNAEGHQVIDGTYLYWLLITELNENKQYSIEKKLMFMK